VHQSTLEYGRQNNDSTRQLGLYQIPNFFGSVHTHKTLFLEDNEQLDEVQGLEKQIMAHGRRQNLKSLA
jgi:hypothetical protein